MRFSIFALAAAAATFVSAQDLSGVPTCALPCFAAAVPASGCSLTDTKCQCTTGKDSITNSLLKCAPAKCSMEDQGKLAPAVAKLCSAVGVSVGALPTAAVSSMASGAVSASASASAASSSASKSASMSGSATGSASPAQSTGGAAAGQVIGYGAVAMGVAAVALGL